MASTRSRPSPCSKTATNLKVKYPHRTFATVDHIVPTNELKEPYSDPIAQEMIEALRKNTKDYGIRFYGIPSGYEFSTLVEGIQMVGAGDSGLSQATKDALAKLDKPVHMQVFITPTCPYCPKAVHVAHQMAMESPFVQADMVEAIEFPHLSNKYSVMGVPRTVINEDTHVEGAMPEPMILQKVLMSVN